MKTVNDIYNIVTKNHGTKVCAKIDNEVCFLAPPFYIEDEILYLSKFNDERESEHYTPLTTEGLEFSLEKEATDNCWIYRDGIEIGTTFTDVELMVCDKDFIDDESANIYGVIDEDANFYEVVDIVFENLCVVMVCEKEKAYD